jgi:hypothetical protein
VACCISYTISRLHTVRRIIIFNPFSILVKPPYIETGSTLAYFLEVRYGTFATAFTCSTWKIPYWYNFLSFESLSYFSIISITSPPRYPLQNIPSKISPPKYPLQNIPSKIFPPKYPLQNIHLCMYPHIGRLFLPSFQANMGCKVSPRSCAI